MRETCRDADNSILKKSFSVGVKDGRKPLQTVAFSSLTQAHELPSCVVKVAVVHSICYMLLFPSSTFLTGKYFRMYCIAFVCSAVCCGRF